MLTLRPVAVALAVSTRAEEEEKFRVSSPPPSDDDDDVDDIEENEDLDVDVPEQDDALAGLAGLSDILGDFEGIEDSVAKLKKLLAERGDIDDDLKAQLTELDVSLGSIGVNTKVTPGGAAAAAAEACVSLVSAQPAMKGEAGAALLESVAWDNAVGSSLAAAEAADEDANLDSLDDDDDDDEAEPAGTVSVDLTRQNAAGRLVYACLATISEEESGLVARGELSELPQAAVASAKGDTVEVPRNLVQPARERAATFAGAMRQMASAADPRVAGAAIEVPLVAQLFAGAALLAILWVGGKLFATTRAVGGKSGARERSARKQARAESKKAKKNK